MRRLATLALFLMTWNPLPAQELFPGYDPTYLDRKVRPQADFYHFALGGYARTHPIPPDLSGYGTYPAVAERVRETLHQLLETLPGDSPEERKLLDFYRSGMDEAALEAAGATPLQPYLRRLEKVDSRSELANEMARFCLEGLGSGAFTLSSLPAMLDPTMRVAELDQGGLGLPSRDYYFQPRHAKILAAYRSHVEQMFLLLDESPAQAARDARTVVRVETALAGVSLSPVQMRDPKQRLHPMARADLAERYPSFPWSAYLDQLGLNRVRELNVATPSFLDGFDRLWTRLPLGDWKTFVRWRLLSSTAAFLSSAFEDEQFEFSRNFSGAPRKPARWKKMVSLTDAYLGMALGRIFVERSFSPEARARAEAMIGNIRAALRERIEKGWMSPATRQEALAKLDGLDVKVGYPDKWKDYSLMRIQPGAFFANVIEARRFATLDSLDRIGQPIDRREWDVSPCTVNAFYDPTRNSICFPAGRLQPPFFDVKADDALNYGATGVTMGHEMSHGYDDEGSQYDARGQFRNWWTPEDLASFTAKADAVAAQMSEYSYEGQTVNGKLVEGEAIADQAGVGLAFEALRRAQAGRPPQRTRDGFSEEQRFYLGYALCRASFQRPAAARAQMARDPHPLGMFRVNGPLSNEPGFFEAFQCKPGDPMMRLEARRIRLWDR